MLANGMPIEFLAIGFVTPFLVLLLIAFIESIISSKFLPLPWKRTFRIWLAANAVSALGGFIVLWSFGGNFVFWELILSSHSILDDIQRTLPRLAAYYFETVIVEFIVLWAAFKRVQSLPLRRIAATVILANLTTYLLLIPLLALGLVGGDRGW